MTDSLLALSNSLALPRPLDPRHTCVPDDGMVGYGRAVYDPRKCGILIVNDIDNNVDLQSYFAKTPDND